MAKQVTLNLGVRYDYDDNTSRTKDAFAPRRGVRPAAACLNPDGRGGMAVISAACRAQLVANQNQLAAGGFVNTEPLLVGNRKLGFLYQINAGVEREIMRGMAVTVDYVGSRGHDQTGRIDLNEPRLLALIGSDE